MIGDPRTLIADVNAVKVYRVEIIINKINIKKLNGDCEKWTATQVIYVSSHRKLNGDCENGLQYK